MNTVDAAVLGLNASVAWVEKDGLIYEFETGEWMQKHHFIKGSKYSALKVIVPVLKGPGGTKTISVADAFLTHPLARRYQDIVFRPDKKEAEFDGYYNMWQGFEHEDGDVSPFLELSEFLFSKSEAGDVPLKLVAYKAQNPSEKIPLAPVLIGTQGCGKSLWSQIVRESFGQYGVVIRPKALLSDFNPFVEKSLIGVIDEAGAEQVVKGAETLKSLISDEAQQMNEKYRTERQVRSYTMYILTSNERRVGAYSKDDRRMIVIDCPRKREGAFYDRVGAWRKAGGPKYVMNWLLNYDLKGWKPPKEVKTAEKYMAYMENLTPIQRLAEEMETADENVVKAWLDQTRDWCKNAALDDRTATQAREVSDAIQHYDIRPFYTAEELATIFPAVVGTLHGAKAQASSAGQISRGLRECGVEFLRSTDDYRGFKWRGRWRQFLVVADRADWSEPMSQQDFERVMKNCPKYGEV